MTWDGNLGTAGHSFMSVTSRHVMSRQVMSRHVTSCHVTSCHVTSCHVTSCHVTSCRVTSSRHVTSCHVTSCHVTSHHVMSFMSCQQPSRYDHSISKPAHTVAIASIRTPQPMYPLQVQRSRDVIATCSVRQSVLRMRIVVWIVSCTVSKQTDRTAPLLQQ